jgi:hypothetical protein
MATQNCIADAMILKAAYGRTLNSICDSCPIVLYTYCYE